MTTRLALNTPLSGRNRKPVASRTIPVTGVRRTISAPSRCAAAAKAGATRKGVRLALAGAERTAHEMVGQIGRDARKAGTIEDLDGSPCSRSKIALRSISASARR